MPKFSDCLGREWELRITLGMLPRLREAGLSISKGQSVLECLEALSDPETLGKVVDVLVGDQLEKKKLDIQGLLDAIDGGVIEDFFVAFAGAHADFTQPRKIAEKFKTVLPGMIERQENLILANFEANSGSNVAAGNSQESRELTVEIAQSAS